MRILIFRIAEKFGRSPMEVEGWAISKIAEAAAYLILEAKGDIQARLECAALELSRRG